MKVKSNVFSKSNIILGVLIAFAMVVLAVPVFAEQPVTVTVPLEFRTRNCCRVNPKSQAIEGIVFLGIRRSHL